jgi:hypothetical protein
MMASPVSWTFPTNSEAMAFPVATSIDGATLMIGEFK